MRAKSSYELDFVRTRIGSPTVILGHAIGHIAGRHLGLTTPSPIVDWLPRQDAAHRYWGPDPCVITQDVGGEDATVPVASRRVISGTTHVGRMFSFSQTADLLVGCQSFRLRREFAAKIRLSCRMSNDNSVLF